MSHDCQSMLCCSLLHASVIRKGQSCCNDQDISQWEIKTVYYFLVLQNICQGVQGLPGSQSPVCKRKNKRPGITGDGVWQHFEEHCKEGRKVKLPLIYVSWWKLPLLLDLQLSNGFSQAARPACPPQTTTPASTQRERGNSTDKMCCWYSLLC